MKNLQKLSACDQVLHSLMQRYGPAIKFLPDKPEETVESTVRALWLRAQGRPTSSLRAMSEPLTELTHAQMVELTELLELRTQGKPLAHLTGRQHFSGLEFKCGPAALIPRKETEILADAARTLITREILPHTPKPKILDLCTGCGNLACTVAYHIPQCTVFAADLSAEGARLAEENARALGCDQSLGVFVGDLFEPFAHEQFANSFDLILCNPPYISTTRLQQMHPEIIDHEPRMAFDAGPFGLTILGRLLHDVPHYTKPGGWFAIEVGRDQGEGIMKNLSRDKRYKHINAARDHEKKVRALWAQIDGLHRAPKRTS